MSPGFALAFPGQGSQRSGMLGGVPPVVGFDRLIDAAEALCDIELRAIDKLGTEEDLADTRVAQPLLYLTDWAWGSAVIEAGMAPSMVAGHSLGELVALATAGVISVEAGLELVVERSRAMAAAAREIPGSMMAVLGMDGPDVAESTSGISGVWVANDNAPGQVVLSGTHEGLAAAEKELVAAGARKIVPLNVAGAFHSPVMKPASDVFAEVVLDCRFDEASIPVVQNSNPTPATDPEIIKERLLAQMSSPVRWTETMSAMREAGIHTLVEAGPGSVLAGLAKRIEGLSGISAEQTGIDAIMEGVV